MAAEPTFRLEAKEDVFQANHRKHTRLAIAVAVAAAAVTALTLSAPLLRDPEDPPLGLAYVFFIAVFAVVFWTLAAMAFQIAKRDVRFYADEREFQPIRLDRPHRSHLVEFWLPVRRVRYEEVERAVHDSVWVSPGVKLGLSWRWVIVMYLKDGSEAWVYDAPEIPEEAYRFLLGHLQCRGIPVAVDE